MTTELTEPRQRIASIDILRGLVIVIMTIDHVRDFFQYGHPKPLDLATTTPILFFTRWITHYCAPTFVFLSGVSAWLAGSRRSNSEFRAFLIKRGLWLMAVEVILISLAITADPLYHMVYLEVIFAIGSGMLLLALMVGLPLWVIGSIGFILVFGHNLLDPQFFPVKAVNQTFLGNLLLLAPGPASNLFFDAAHNHAVLAVYALLPWAGVMMMGYVFGSFYVKTYDATRRRKTLFYSGVGALVLFLVFRYFNIYGDPNPWTSQPTETRSVLSFFNITKSPPSLMYVCMTLGVSLIVLSIAEGIKNKFTVILHTYGSVPFFYFIAHLYLIRLGTIALFFATGHNTAQINNPNTAPLLFQPDDMGVSLGGVYIIWLMVVVALYFPCRWYGRYKQTHRTWWLSYL